MASWRQGIGNRNIVLATVAVMLVALLVGGCAAVQKDRRTTSLESVTRAHFAALRWGDFEAALAFLPPEARAEQDLSVFEDLRITRYEVLRPAAMLSETEASQTVAIEYIHEYNQIVRRITDRQTWRWDDEAQTWRLESGLPAF